MKEKKELRKEDIEFLEYLKKPIEEEELKRICPDYSKRLGEVGEYVLMTQGYLVLNEKGWNLFFELDYKNLKLAPKEIWQNYLEKEGMLYPEINTKGETVLKISRDNLFKYITEKLFENRFFTLTDNEEIYVYNKGVYENINNAELRNILYCILRDRGLRNILNEILDRIRYYNIIDRENLNNPKDKICLNNGVLDLKKFRLENFNPEYYFFNRVPINYDPQADCPLIKETLKLNLPEEEDRLTLFEISGYCLIKGNPLQKYFILVGEGKEGKSFIINLICKFLGEKNITAIPLQDIAQDKNYCRAKISNKLLCYFADIPSKELNDLSFLKSITGEDTVTARNIYGRPFDFRYQGKMLYSANKLPNIPEDNRAVWRRTHLMILNYPVPEDKRDLNILEKVATPEELSGLLNEAIKGLKRILGNGKFTKELSEEEIREKYLSRSDIVFNFIKDCIEDTNTNEYITQSTLYSHFMNYCSKNNKITISQKKFKEKIITLKKVRYERLSSGSFKGQYAYFGIRVKDMSEDSEQSEALSGKSLYATRGGSFEKNLHSRHFVHSKKEKQDNIPVNTDKSLQEIKVTPQMQFDLLKNIIYELKKTEENNIEKIEERWKEWSKIYTLYDIREIIEKLSREGIVYQPKAGIYEVV